MQCSIHAHEPKISADFCLTHCMHAHTITAQQQRALAMKTLLIVAVVAVNNPIPMEQTLLARAEINTWHQLMSQCHRELDWMSHTPPRACAQAMPYLNKIADYSAELLQSTGPATYRKFLQASEYTSDFAAWHNSRPQR